MSRRANPLVTIRNWIADARKEIHCANRSGVREAARRLGLRSHSHLSRVLRGERESQSLIRRYNQLKESA